MTWFGRLELVGKAAHALHAEAYIRETIPVGKLEGGYMHDLANAGPIRLGVGGTVSGSVVPQLLAPRYGGRLAPGFGIVLFLRPDDRRESGVHHHPN